MQATDTPRGVDASWVGFSLNVCLFSAQFPLMWRMLQDSDPASRSKYSYFPALGQWATCTFWLAYNICVLPVPSIIAVNAIGVGLAFFYWLFFVVCRPTLREKLEVAAAFAVVAALVVLIYGLAFGLQYERASMVTSIITIFVNVSLWATPLQALRESAKELSLKRVSVPLTFIQAAAA